LCADSVDWWPPLLQAWRRVYRCPWLPLTQDNCPPTSRAWKELLADPDLRRSRNAAEAQLLWELRQALRRGSLYIPHSLDYRSRDALFNLEGTSVRAPGSARAAPEFLDQLCAHLEVALENLPSGCLRPSNRVSAHLETGNKIRRFVPGGGGLARIPDEHLAGTLPPQMLVKSTVLAGQHRPYADQWP